MLIRLWCSESRFCVLVRLKKILRQAPAGAGWKCRGEPFQIRRTVAAYGFLRTASVSCPASS